MKANVLKASSMGLAIRFLRDRSAAAVVEYALLVALAATAIGIGLNELNDSVGTVYQHLDSELNAQTAVADGTLGEAHAGNARENQLAGAATGRRHWTGSGRGASAAGTGAGASQSGAHGDIAGGSAGVSESDDHLTERGGRNAASGGNGTGPTASAGASGAAIAGDDAAPNVGAREFRLGDAASFAPDGPSSGVRTATSGESGGGSGGQSGGGGQTAGGGTPTGTRVADSGAGRGAGVPFGHLGADDADVFGSPGESRVETGKPAAGAPLRESLRKRTAVPARSDAGNESPAQGTIPLVALGIILVLFAFLIIFRARPSRLFGHVNRARTTREAAGTWDGGAGRIRR